MLREYVCVDLEMTGLNPKEDRIIEIGAVKVIDGDIVEKYAVLVNPHRKLEAHIAEMTGLTDEQLEEGVEDEEAIRGFITFAGQLPLVGHHIISDISFLRTCGAKYKEKVNNLVVDTLGIARKLLPETEKKSLEALCKYIGIETKGIHRALEDAGNTHKLLQWMMRQEACKPDWYSPRELQYKVKKQSPVTKRQIQQLQELLQYHHLEMDIEIGSLTKNEASRKIDKILFSYGRIPKA